MITLYVKTGCPFCAVALKKVADLGLQIEEKNIADDAVASELVAVGGKRQVPYLVDSEKNVSMYESSDIAAYLEKTYGQGDDDEVSPKGGIHLHKEDDADVCEVCQ